MKFKFVFAAILLSPDAFAQKNPAWLENSVIYQVYPSSYKDSDGEHTYLIALNPTGTKQSVTLPGFNGKNGSLKPALCSGKVSCKLSSKGAKLVMGPTSVLICKLPE